MTPNYIPDDIDFEAYYEQTEAKAHVRPAGAYLEDIVAMMRVDRAEQGDWMPWSKMHGRFQLRPREVTGWIGFKGHAKSAVLSEVMLAQMRAKRRVLVISPEFPPIEVLLRKVRQSAASADPAERYVRLWTSWANKHLWLFDKQSSLNPELVLGVVAYAINELQVNHIVVDSLMKCGIKGHDQQLYANQKLFVDRLQHLAHASQDTHIHLVMHAKKPGDDDSKPPTMYDGKGASELVDMLENILVVHMNRRKQIEREGDPGARSEEPDVTITIEAQRNYPRLGRFGLWFAPGLRFVGGPDQRAAPYFAPELEVSA